jgi:hypothetical protein
MIENDQVALFKFEKFSILVERLQKNGGKRRKPVETLEAQRSVTIDNQSGPKYAYGVIIGSVTRKWTRL